MYILKYLEFICVGYGQFHFIAAKSVRWRHDGRDIVSNHQPHDCLLGRVFRRRSKKTSKLRVTGLCAGNSPGPVNSPHKWPVTRKMLAFDDVIVTFLWVDNGSLLVSFNQVGDVVNEHISSIENKLIKKILLKLQILYFCDCFICLAVVKIL